MDIQVDYILCTIQRHHSTLSGYYSGLRTHFHDSRTVDLLNHLVSCEQYREKHVMSLRRSIGPHHLVSFLKFPGGRARGLLDRLGVDESRALPADYNGITRVSLEYDVLLKSICREISVVVEDSQMKELFSDICREAEREIRNLFSYNSLFAC